jgi:hypothetical protein
MILLFIASVSLMVQFVSMSPILDSSSKMDHTVSFRRSPCFNTLEGQNDFFYSMTLTPYKSWQRPGLDANGNSSAPLQVKHLRSCLKFFFIPCIK